MHYALFYSFIISPHLPSSLKLFFMGLLCEPAQSHRCRVAYEEWPNMKVLSFFFFFKRKIIATGSVNPIKNWRYSLRKLFTPPVIIVFPLKPHPSKSEEKNVQDKMVSLGDISLNPFTLSPPVPLLGFTWTDLTFSKIMISANSSQHIPDVIRKWSCSNSIPAEYCTNNPAHVHELKCNQKDQGLLFLWWLTVSSHEIKMYN